jgi:hypothetical protein
MTPLTMAVLARTSGVMLYTIKTEFVRTTDVQKILLILHLI